MNLPPQLSPGRPPQFPARIDLRIGSWSGSVVAALVTVLLLAAAARLPAQESLARPNIILIMADDMGWSDIGCYGSEIHTPNIDRIAGEGMLFTNFYNNAKCTTTRASLLTGLYPRNGGRGSELLTPNMLTLGEAMQLTGYQTGMSGKWHNGSKAPHRPFDRGFYKSYGLWDGGCNFFDPAQPDPKFKGGKVRFFGEDDRRITEFPEDFYTTDAFTDHAVATIREQAKTGQPFFHYIAHTAPHYPLHARPEDIAKYQGRYDAGWDALRAERRERQISMGLYDPEVWPLPGPNPDNTPWEKRKPLDLDWQTKRMEVLAAMIDRMDQNIGRVLDLLDELSIAENTLVIFLADNGGCSETPGGNDVEQVPGPKDFYSHCGPDWAYAENTPLRHYKSTTYEGGVATPMVARWPAAIAAGSRSDQVGHIIDFLPTFLSAAGGEYPLSHKDEPLLQLEGLDLTPVLSGKKTTLEREAPLFWHWSGSRAVREENWKLVWDKAAKKWQLYDLATDRTETRDLAAEQPSVVDQMATKWIAWATEMDVKF